MVEVISIEDGGFYADEYTSGSTVNVTLCKGDMFAKCEGILIWDEDGANDDTFDEWVAMAEDGEEGYSMWVA